MAKKKNGKQPLAASKRASAGGPGRNKAAGMGGDSQQGTYLSHHQRLVSQVPRKTGTRWGMRIRNSEYVQDWKVDYGPGPEIAGGYQEFSLRCNPGESFTFPWLAIEAEGYEFYKFHKLEFHFVSRLPAVKLGVAMMMIDPDPTDPSPNDAQTFMVSPHASADVVWSNNRTSLSPDLLNNFVAGGGHGYYITHGEEAQASDLRLVDCARAWFATEGLDATASELGQEIIGSIYVTYDVELSFPNSERRLVTLGTYDKQFTQPGGLLPKKSLLFRNSAGSPQLLTTTPERLFTGVHDPMVTPPTGSIGAQLPDTDVQGLIMRNAYQYWDVVRNAFVMPKGKWLFNWVMSTYCEGSVTPSASIYQSLICKVFRPSTGQTATLGCSRGGITTSSFPTANLYQTEHLNDIVVITEDGDEVWAEATATELSGPPTPIYISDSDPSTVTLEQLDI
jgi:hypothetical protein